MFNKKLANRFTFNRWVPFVLSTITDDIIFNSFWLQNANIITSFKDDYNLPRIDLNTYENPVIDWGWILNRKYTDKDITLKWVLLADTASLLQTLIDNFKLKTSEIEWYLEIKVDWIYRRTKATCIKSNLFDKKNYDITRCPFEITFKTLEPFFYLRSDETVLEAWVTNDITVDISYSGTARSYPKMLFAFNAGNTGVTQVAITLNGKTITISDTFINWDVMIVNCETKSVLVNGVDTDYDWVFPNLEYWTNIIETVFTKTTLNVDMSFLYAKNYL